MSALPEIKIRTLKSQYPGIGQCGLKANSDHPGPLPLNPLLKESSGSIMEPESLESISVTEY